MREHGTKTAPVFLPADREASWGLLSSLVSLLSGSIVQLENIYSHMLKVTGQLWEKQKKDEHQHWSQLPSAFISLSQSQLIQQ